MWYSLHKDSEYTLSYAFYIAIGIVGFDIIAIIVPIIECYRFPNIPELRNTRDEKAGDEEMTEFFI